MPTPNMFLPSKLKSREERDQLNSFHMTLCTHILLALASKGFTVFALDKVNLHVLVFLGLYCPWYMIPTLSLLALLSICPCTKYWLIVTLMIEMECCWDTQLCNKYRLEVYTSQNCLNNSTVQIAWKIVPFHECVIPNIVSEGWTPQFSNAIVST